MGNCLHVWRRLIKDGCNNRLAMKDLIILFLLWAMTVILVAVGHMEIAIAPLCAEWFLLGLMCKK